MFEVSVEQTFAAGHALRNYKGKCENVHGHNYRVRITVQGDQLDSTGLLVDFLDVKGLIGGSWTISTINSSMTCLPLTSSTRRPRT
jgi:6-pyruvoyl tetrahydropterin synthase/QueD family protein